MVEIRTRGILSFPLSTRELFAICGFTDPMLWYLENEDPMQGSIWDVTGGSLSSQVAELEG